MKSNIHLIFLIFVIVPMFLSNKTLAQDTKFYLTHGQTASIMSISKIEVTEKSNEEVIQDLVDDAISQRLVVKDSFSKKMELLPIREGRQKEVKLKNDHQIIGEFLLEKDQVLSGNNNIWMVTGSIVIYKVRLKKQEEVQSNNNSNQFEPRSGFDYFLKKLTDGTIGTKDHTAVRKQLEPLIEFEEAILRTVSKSGTGNSKEMAINNIIRSIKYDDLTITSDR